MLKVIAKIGGVSEHADVREKLRSMYSPVGPPVERYTHSKSSVGWFRSRFDLWEEKQIELVLLFRGVEVYHENVWLESRSDVNESFEYGFSGPTQFFPPKMYGED